MRSYNACKPVNVYAADRRFVWSAVKHVTKLKHVAETVTGVDVNLHTSYCAAIDLDILNMLQWPRAWELSMGAHFGGIH